MLVSSRPLCFPSLRVRAARPDPAPRLWRWLVPLLLGAALAAWAAAAQARQAPDSFADLAESLLPAVVNVSTTQELRADDLSQQELEQFFKDFFDRRNRGDAPRRATSLGSGFVIDSSGYIVTNNHVIEGADQITVKLHDDTELEAKVVGIDTKTDLALLKVEPKTPLVAARWGDSDKTRIGDWVLAIGNPFGLGGSVTAGIVSARQRDINAGPYDEFIQTDASINRGNSGGPMFNMDGEVIGINTAIFSPSGGSVGIGFAIPSNLARNVIEQLQSYGHARRGWLGVRIQSVSPELAEGLRLPNAKGALIANVTAGGPADAAGIRQGDVILEFNGHPIDEMRKLPRIVAETPIDKEVEVVLWRQGAKKTVTVKVGELDESAEQAAAEEPQGKSPGGGKGGGDVPLLGLTVTELTADLRDQFKLERDVEGVLVIGVDPDGAAAEKGLKEGDVVIEVDQKAVATADDVKRRVDEAKSNGYRVVTLLVYRTGDYQWIAVRIDRG
jgi:serine protease Do